MNSDTSHASVCRFKLTLGNSTFEVEGTQAFVREAIDELLLRASMKLLEIAPQGTNAEVRGLTSDDASGSTAQPGVSVSMIANRMRTGNAGQLSGSDLVLAACVKLHATDGLEVMTRAQIYDAMKSAPSFHKESYGGNLSKYLATLVRDGQLHEHGSGRYALSARSIESMRQFLSDELGPE